MRPLAHSILPRLVSLLTLISFLQIKICSSVEVQGFEVKDLAGSGSCFQLQSTSWSASSLVTASKMTSTCVKDILGGPNILATSSDMSFQRVYQYLPFHNKIYFALTLYAIDSWASAQLNKPLIEITFDSTTMGNITAQQVSTPSLCGSTASDFSVRIFGKIDHNANTLFFKIGSNNSLSSSVGSFGIRSVSLILSSDSITADNRICAIGSGVVTGNCSCSEGQYLDSAGNCQPCSTNCSSCFGPTSGECYECKTGYGYNGYECVKCDSSCGSCLSTASNGCTGCKDMFALYNGVCRSSCPAPLNQTMDACEVSFCQSACAPPKVLFPDNYCGTACASPLLTMLVSGSLQCKSPCPAGVPFLYWNGTCQGICESPLQNKTDHGISYCEYTCPDNEYLHTNGSCLDSCSLPLKEETQGGKLFCLYPCSSNQYVLPNGSCTEACLPIDRYIENNKNYCHYPSLAPPVVCYPPDYMYWNSSCLSTCNFPLQVETDAEGIDYCEYPCSSTEFLYWNGSCLNQCESPLHQRIESGYLFCDAACGQRQYITLNGTCLDSCETPLRIKASGNSKLCLLPCDDPTMYYHEGNQQCSPDCDSPAATSLNGYLYCPDDDDNNTDSIFGSTIEAGDVTFITLTKYMQYVRYLDVKMPNRLEILAASSGRPVLSLQPSQGLVYRIQGWFSNRRLSVIVSKQVLPPRFLANFGGELIVLAIVCALAFIFTYLKVMSKKKKWQVATLVFEKLQILTRWNFLVMLFSLQIDEVILFSALEFSMLDFDGPAAAFSFIFCLAAIGVTIAFVIGLFKVTRKSFATQERLSHQKNEEMSPTGIILGALNEGLQVIYSGFNTSRSFNKFFYLFYVCRTALPMLLAIIFSTVPVVQAVFQIIVSLIIVAYISYMRPLKNKINHYQLMIIETIVLIMNMSVLILTILGKQDMSSKSSDIFFGDVVIIGNITINALIIAILILKAVYMIKDIKSLYHKDPFQAKLSCIHLLTLPLQQGAFGFEQLLPDINPPSSSPALANNQKQVIITETAQVPDGKISPKKNMSPKKIPQEDTISPSLVTQKSMAHRNTSLGVEEEQTELPTTERFGQSSARLLITSQVLNQSQVIPQINNLVSTNDSILDLSTSSPRNKRALSSFLKNMNVPTVINLGGSTRQTRQTRANSHYEDYEKDPRPVDLSRSSMIVRTRQIRDPITRAQTNMDISGNEGGNNNCSLPPIPNRGLIVRKNSTATNLRQEL